MKIVIIGGAGVRTPGIIESFYRRQNRIEISELCLMDIDEEQLQLIGSLTEELEKSGKLNFQVTRTIDSTGALENADFVITTFRVGGIESRVIDERIALENGVLGQETTGAGGFSMAIRTIPVLQNYIDIMKIVCPNAWLLNFANPSGILTEFILRKTDWNRAVGICDGPASMRHYAARLLGTNYNEIYLDYFGLNHLGWVRKVLYNGENLLPVFIKKINDGSLSEELPFSATLINSLGLIPNEYNYYYYYAKKAVDNIQKAEQTRGEQIEDLNDELFEDLKNLQGKTQELQLRYQKYQFTRWNTYMKAETGRSLETSGKIMNMEDTKKQAEEGYAGVALDLIEGLSTNASRTLILNTTNEGAIDGIDFDATVEIPVYVGKNLVRPMNVGKIPTHCLGLMNQVKHYEQLTIDAAITKSYDTAVSALTLHPLIADEDLAKKIIDGYSIAHGEYYPKLVKRSVH
jgi:6-phospho-beta-glucosidase